MKATLIHIKTDFTPVVPMGILFIGTILKEKGHNVMVLDINEKEDITEKIEKFSPDLIGLSVETTSYFAAKEITKKLREKFPDIYYCWGSVHTSALPEETLNDNNLDFVVYGEGEYTMLEICNKFDKEGKLNLHDVKGVCYFKDGKVIKNPPRELIKDLDSLPIPDRSLLDNFEWYLSPPGFLRGKCLYGITTMSTTRGCPGRCIFCACHIIHGYEVRRRSVANVIKEMEYLKREFGVTGIYFNDDTFATDIKWLKEFCDILKKSKINMMWGCQTRANIMQDLDTVKMMKSAGCVQADIGCESGSDKILKIMKKGISSKTIFKAFENLKKVKMTTFATFIVGFPEETLEDIKKTEALAKAVPGMMNFYILSPYPGTEIYYMAKKNGWFTRENIVFNKDWAVKESDNPIIAASFKPEELIKIRAKLQNKFFLKNITPTLMRFLRSPDFTWKMIKTVAGNPAFFSRTLIKAMRRGKTEDFAYEIYQQFNKNLKEIGMKNKRTGLSLK